MKTKTLHEKKSELRRLEKMLSWKVLLLSYTPTITKGKTRILRTTHYCNDILF